MLDGAPIGQFVSRETNLMALTDWQRHLAALPAPVWPVNDDFEPGTAEALRPPEKPFVRRLATKADRGLFHVKHRHQS